MPSRGEPAANGAWAEWALVELRELMAVGPPTELALAVPEPLAVSEPLPLAVLEPLADRSPPVPLPVPGLLALPEPLAVPEPLGLEPAPRPRRRSRSRSRSQRPGPFYWGPYPSVPKAWFLRGAHSGRQPTPEPRMRAMPKPHFNLTRRHGSGGVPRGSPQPTREPRMGAMLGAIIH